MCRGDRRQATGDNPHNRAATTTCTTRQQRQHAWRNTYREHETHVRHRARVPFTNGLVEGRGILRFSQGRVCVWSEWGCVEATGDRGQAAQQGSNDSMHEGKRTKNMPSMSSTELVVQLPMVWLKAEASYDSARDGCAYGESEDVSRRQATGDKPHNRAATTCMEEHVPGTSYACSSPSSWSSYRWAG